MDLAEIERLETLPGAAINEAKIALATEATRLCHGHANAEAAVETARQTFSGEGVSKDLPSIAVSAAELDEGIALFDLLRQAGLVKSNGEARRLIKGGGARINDEPVREEMARVDADALGDQGFFKLSAGKKRHVLVRPE